MIDRQTLSRATCNLLRAGWRLVGSLLAVGLVAIAWTLLAGESPGPQRAGTGAAAPGWGHEAVADVRERMREVSPIGLANACGMGSSSCAKCHNGTRASVPKPEKWHSDHKSVNDSCVGCHRGNSRLMKADLAHGKMIADPRTQPETCATCHKSDNAKLLNTYKK